MLENNDIIDLTQGTGGGTSDGANKSLSNINATAKETIAHLSSPSNYYVDLTLEPSGYVYTAPADGTVYLNRRSGATGQYIFLFCNGTSGDNALYCKREVSTDSVGTVPIYIDVKKGDNFAFNYTLSGAILHFRFIYKEGAKP